MSIKTLVIFSKKKTLVTKTVKGITIEQFKLGQVPKARVNSHSRPRSIYEHS